MLAAVMQGRTEADLLPKLVGSVSTFDCLDAEV
jgi:hypothetical protein